MKSIEETIYNLVGNRQNPSSDKDEVVKNLNIYLEVYKKLDLIESFAKNIDLFLNKNKIECVEFSIEKERHRYYYIYNIEIVACNDSEIENFEDLSFYFFDLVSNHDTLLKYFYDYKVDYLRINKKNLKELSNSIISVSDLEIYNKIENFEKNKLEEVIGESFKKPSISKLKL